MVKFFNLCILMCLFLCAFVVGIFLLKKYVKEYSTIEIAFITNNDYAPHLGATIASILKYSADDEKFNFYVLENNLSNENKENFLKLKKIKNFNLTFIHIDRERFQKLKVTRTALETYFRYILPEILPDKNKILYLDADIIVLGSLKELWETDITDYYAAGSVNGGLDPSRLGITKYINAGVVLFNLDKMRADNITHFLFENTLKLEKEGLLKLEDQDVINYTLQDKILFVPDKYNHPGYASLQKDTIIVHFVIYKPWKGKMKNFDVYYEARQMTPWAYKEDIYVFKGQNWNSTVNFNSDKTRICRLDNKQCGTIQKSMAITWDDGTREVYTLDFDKKYAVFGGRHTSRIVAVKHKFWEDDVYVSNTKACRLSNNDCGDILYHTKNKLQILWKGKNTETFLLKNKVYHFVP